MQIIKQGWEWMVEPDGEQMLRLIEQAGRLCYKSEDKITDTSHEEFVRRAIDIGHHSIIEHANCSVRMITDRGVTHEIVRHRIASYSQESTRYCNYGTEKFGGGITVILPVEFYDTFDIMYGESSVGVSGYDARFNDWNTAMVYSEKAYLDMLAHGCSPQLARSVLPNSLKTEIIMTANVREWRHFFTLRCSKKAHPQMRDLACSMLLGFSRRIPIIFDDIKDKVIEEEVK